MVFFYNLQKTLLILLHRSLLLVFDKYDSPKDFPNIYEYFPKSSSGAILFTSRHADSTRLGDVVEMGGMTEEEGVELLLSQCAYKDTTENVFKGRKIVRTLGYLPLAIDQAGAYIRARSETLHTIWARSEPRLSSGPAAT
jgi:hypothetical protein